MESHVGEQDVMEEWERLNEAVRNIYLFVIHEHMIIVNKTVTLIGNGTSNTTIDAGGSGDVVYITADWVNASRFKIMNGSIGVYIYSNYSMDNSNTYSIKVIIYLWNNPIYLHSY